MKHTIFTIAAAAALCAFALPASAAQVAGGCKPTTFRFVASDKNDSSTTLGTYVNLPEAAINIALRSAGCVIVTFSAEFNSGGHPVGMRAYLDNTTAALPNDMQFTQSVNEINARSFTFIFPSVAAGSHTLRMQFSSGIPGQAVIVRKHNTLVHYTP